MKANYLIIAAALFIPAITLIWHTWQSHIRPLFIPKQEIQTLTDQLIKTHGHNAYDFAHQQETRAWRQAETYQQAKWKKIGKAIRNKQPNIYG